MDGIYDVLNSRIEVFASQVNPPHDHTSPELSTPKGNLYLSHEKPPTNKEESIKAIAPRSGRALPPRKGIRDDTKEVQDQDEGKDRDTNGISGDGVIKIVVGTRGEKKDATPNKPNMERRGEETSRKLMELTKKKAPFESLPMK